MMRTLRLGLPLVLVLFALSACGGDDDSSSPGVNSGLPPDSTLSSLSAGDVKKLCTSWVTALNAALPASILTRVECVSLAAAVSVTSGSNGMVNVDVNACNQSVTQCEQQAASQPSSSQASVSITEVDCSAADVNASIASCHAEVKDFEQCTGALLTAAKAQLDALQCANLAKLANSSDSDPTSIDISSVPECSAFRTACPNLDLTGSSDSDSSSP
jgi:hypothetical protein